MQEWKIIQVRRTDPGVVLAESEWISDRKLAQKAYDDFASAADDTTAVGFVKRTTTNPMFREQI